ncbi:MAG: MarR family winged helix-turn-helix transcriptional regulator [Ilumatobacteraceae bacterium]
MDHQPALREDPIDLAKQHWREQGWAEAADGMGVVTSVMRVHQIMLSRVERVLRPFGLTFARYEVLMLLRFSRHGSLPIGRAGERLQVHPASVTNAVDRLERDGLVRRRPNPEDRRGVLVELTADGRSRADAATTAINEVFTTLPLDGAGLDTVYGVLREIRHAVGDFA